MRLTVKNGSSPMTDGIDSRRSARRAANAASISLLELASSARRPQTKRFAPPAHCREIFEFGISFGLRGSDRPRT